MRGPRRAPTAFGPLSVGLFEKFVGFSRVFEAFQGLPAPFFEVFLPFPGFRKSFPCFSKGVARGFRPRSSSRWASSGSSMGRWWRRTSGACCCGAIGPWCWWRRSGPGAPPVGVSGAMGARFEPVRSCLTPVFGPKSRSFHLFSLQHGVEERFLGVRRGR